jgi:hypothetical protein
MPSETGIVIFEGVCERLCNEVELSVVYEFVASRRIWGGELMRRDAVRVVYTRSKLRLRPANAVMLSQATSQC